MTNPRSSHSDTTAEVVIVGGGVIGLSIARELALRGVGDVMLIECSSLAAEASYAAAGLLAPQAETDRADDFFRLACQSRNLYPALAASLLAETGIDIELDMTGSLYLAFTETDQAEIEKRCDWQTRAGLPVEKVTAAEARALEPSISESAIGALLFPQDIQVENRRLLTALIAANDKLKVRLVTDTKVESLRVEHGRVTGVVTANGFVSARQVVLAGGAWTSLLTNAEAAVRIEPVRGQIVCLQTVPRFIRHVLYSPRGYLVPRRDGRILAGSTSEHVGFEKQVTAAGIHSVLSNTLEIAPVAAEFAIIDTWSGLRPRATDELPVIGPCTDIDGLFYATGHYRNGILLAPVTAELIAEAIAGNVQSISPFAPNRFSPVGVSSTR
jgi:glycine oxidase